MSSNLQNNPLVQKLSGLNESTWIHVGSLAEMMNDPEKALKSYENALRHNPYSFSALFQIGSLHRSKEQYGKATEYLQRALNIENSSGEVWSSLGHCYLMMDDLQKAYSAYQQALYHTPSQKVDPKLWYGIGILYDRYGSLEHAEEAFSAVMRMDPNFDKGTEIYFRLGIIYKQQLKFELSLQCFRYILNNPPRPLTDVDIWFQIGHVYEQQKEYVMAKEAYERVLSENSSHAKVLQQLGWLYHQSVAPFADQEKAIAYLNHSIEADSNDAQTFYLLGRCFMAQNKYSKAYEAYQQAVYRDGKNPTFWCSIGVLYYQINQFRDALDAYSRAIRLNPHISEVWYDLGTLYESCNNQIEDARDAYSRALELDPSNHLIRQRLAYLNGSQSGGGAPVPQDVNPNNFQNSYANGNGHIAQFNQGPLGPAPGVQAYPSRPEHPTNIPPPLQFSQPNGDRFNQSSKDQLAPLGHANKITASPNPRGGHYLPNIVREDQSRHNEMMNPPRHHLGNEHGQYTQSLLQHGGSSNSQQGFHRQPIKRTEPNNASLTMDNRRMSIPSPNIPNNRVINGSSAQHHSNYYQHQQHEQRPLHHHEREDPYRQRMNQQPPTNNYPTRPEHAYMNDHHAHQPPQHENSHHSDINRRQHISTKPSPHIGHIIDRPQHEEKNPFNHQDNRNRIEDNRNRIEDNRGRIEDNRGRIEDNRNRIEDNRDRIEDNRNRIEDNKPRPLPPHLTRPSEPIQSPKFTETRPPRYVDEDYDGAADTLVSISQSYANYKNNKQPSPKQNHNESNGNANNNNNNGNSFHPSQRASPLPSPKNGTNGSHTNETNGDTNGTSSRHSASQGS